MVTPLAAAFTHRSASRQATGSDGRPPGSVGPHPFLTRHRQAKYKPIRYLRMGRTVRSILRQPGYHSCTNAAVDPRHCVPRFPEVCLCRCLVRLWASAARLPSGPAPIIQLSVKSSILSAGPIRPFSFAPPPFDGFAFIAHHMRY